MFTGSCVWWDGSSDLFPFLVSDFWTIPIIHSECSGLQGCIASEISVKPNLFSLFLWDPKLALEIFLGPCMLYQYLLQGPGKWAGARRTSWLRENGSSPWGLAYLPVTKLHTLRHYGLKYLYNPSSLCSHFSHY